MLTTPTMLSFLVSLPAAFGAPAVQAPTQEAGFDHTHALLTEVLQEHVKGDRVDYAALVKDRTKLDRYLRGLEKVTRAEFGRWTSDQRYAFWIDAYNAYTLQLIVDNYPLSGIKSLGGWFSTPWEKRFISLQALYPEAAKKKKLSLDDIEHKILREVFKDARIHAAVNCASEGCPPLRNKAFVAEKLGEQLDEQARAWLADTTRNRYERGEKTIRISKVFDWFSSDFERDAGSVRKWVAKYAPEDTARWLKSEEKVKVKYLDYSWKLNDTSRSD